MMDSAGDEATQDSPGLPAAGSGSASASASASGPVALHDPSPSREFNEESWRKTLELCAEVDRVIGDAGPEDKAKAAFSAQLRKMSHEQFGVMKGPTQMVACSRWEAAPKWSMRPRIDPSRASSAPPGPGTYDQKSTVGKAPSYGFGIGTRFRPSGLLGKTAVGPGSYTPKDPLHKIGTKVGFGTSVRVPMGATVLSVPGPGAYEFKTTVGTGYMYTAQGKDTGSYMRQTQDGPGPGAYTPGWRHNSEIKELTKPGFGTSSRDAAHERMMKNPSAPGPGSYEMQQYKGIGREGIKYSAQARRRVEPTQIVSNPGPGAYNSHVTSFGY